MTERFHGGFRRAGVLAALPDEDRRALIDAVLSDIGVPESDAGGVFPASIHEASSAAFRTRRPVCHIVAGANGSGKSTFALHFLPHYAACIAFVNPDLIAGGISPFDPTLAAVKSGRLVLERIAELTAEGRDFGFETTLSGRGYLAQLQALREAGFALHLYYLWTEGCDLLIPRIRQRVLAGGHHVPDQDVRRRYERSLKNIADYAVIMDKIRVFDNSGPTPVLVYEKNGDVRVYDEKRFGRMGGGLHV